MHYYSPDMKQPHITEAQTQALQSPHLTRQRTVHLCAHVPLQLLVRLQQQHLLFPRFGQLRTSVCQLALSGCATGAADVAAGVALSCAWEGIQACRCWSAFVTSHTAKHVGSNCCRGAPTRPPSSCCCLWRPAAALLLATAFSLASLLSASISACSAALSSSQALQVT